MKKNTILILLIFISHSILYSQINKTTTNCKKPQIEKVKIEIKKELLEKGNSKKTEVSKNKSYAFSEWGKGFISALIATFLGFLFTITWDIYKNWRDITKKDKHINRLIIDTLNENLGFIQSINSDLNNEISILEKNQYIVTSVTILKNDFWEILKYNIPKNLFKDNKLKDLQDITNKIKFINENIFSREHYRLNNQSLSNFKSNLKIYNDRIISENTKLFGIIESYLTKEK